MNNVIFLSGLWSVRVQAVMRPMACHQLAWWLRRNKIESQVIEFVQLMTADELIMLIEKCIDETTHSICISTVFWPANPWIIPENIKLAIAYVKTKYPHLYIVGGGQSVSRYGNFFDLHFMDNSEDSLLKYCQEKQNKLGIKNDKFDILTCEHRFSKKDLIMEHETVPMELGRGCIFKCKFCGAPNIGKRKGTYQRKFDLVLDEIKYNYEQFGTTNYMFLDDTINEDPEKVEFLASLKNKLGFQITWCGYIRVDLIWSQNNSDKLFESGLRNAYFGLESLHSEASKSIGKGWNGSHGKEWIPYLYNTLWDKQVKIEASFIVGLPHETESSLLETAEWINKLKAGYMFFYPLDLRHKVAPGAPESEFTREYPKYNYVIDENDQWYNTVTGISRKSAEKLSIKLSNMVVDSCTVSGWTSAQLYNVGMELENIKEVHIRQVAPILNREKDKFINRYINKFLEMYS